MQAGSIDNVTFLQSFGEFLWLSFLLLSPMLLLGLFLSGVLHVLISREAVMRWFRSDSVASVSKSALIGVPMPLCSCSVVPIVAEMRRKGASRSACMSFLITAPETGADSILVTNAFFGWIPAIFRPFASYVTAMVAGTLCIALVREDSKSGSGESSLHIDIETSDTCCHGDDDDEHVGNTHVKLNPELDDCYVPISTLKRLALEVIQDLGRTSTTWFRKRKSPHFSTGGLAAPSDTESSTAPALSNRERSSPQLNLKTVLHHVLQYGFTEIADDILFALLVGILFGGIIYLAVPAELLEYEHARWLAYPVMLIFGVPLYICASASTPIAAALVAKGFSPGSALVFLMTGPATNTSTIAIVVSQFGTRFATIYVSSVVVVTVIIGLLVDALLIWTGFGLVVNLQPSPHTAIELTQIVSAAGLLALIIWRFRAGALKKGFEDLVANIRPAFSSLGRTWTRRRLESS